MVMSMSVRLKAASRLTLSIPDRSGDVFFYSTRAYLPFRGCLLLVGARADRPTRRTGRSTRLATNTDRENKPRSQRDRPAPQRHSVLDAPGHQVAVRRLARSRAGTGGCSARPTCAPAVASASTSSGCAVFAVDPVPDAPQSSQVSQMLLRGGPAGHLHRSCHTARA